jgi:ferredoxin-NADP reductase
MEQELRAGSAVWIKPPYGEFVIDDSRDVVLMAGGTSISAFTAFLEGLKPDHLRKVLLVYGACKPELMIYLQTFLGLLVRVSSFSAVFFQSRHFQSSCPRKARRQGTSGIGSAGSALRGFGPSLAGTLEAGLLLE